MAQDHARTCQGKEPYETAGMAHTVAARMNRGRRRRERRTEINQGTAVVQRCDPREGGCGHHHIIQMPPQPRRRRRPRAPQVRQAIIQSLEWGL